MGEQEGRGPVRAPLTSTGRPSRLLLAVLTLAAVLGVAVYGTVQAVRPSIAPPRPPPFAPGVMWGLRPNGERAAVPWPDVLVYVDDQCPYCAIELDRWSEAVRRGRAAPPTVVVSSRSDPTGSQVPEPLRVKVIHDAERAIARSLDIRSVPYRAVLDSTGVVRDVHVGLTASAALDTLYPSNEEPLEDTR